MGRRSIPPPPALADPALYRWTQDLWRQLSSEQLIPSVRVVTSSSTLSVTDYTLVVDSSSTATVALMPASTVTFQCFHVKRVGSRAVVLNPAGIETIDNALTVQLGSQWSSVHIQSDGTKWIGLGRW